MQAGGQTGLRILEDALGAFFETRGAPRVTTAVLQPAEPYLDTAGEALRRRIFLTVGEGGENLCLRPDFTIPVCLKHLREKQALPRRYGYSGLVFRQRRAGATEFSQAGIEDLGEADLAGADARALGDTLAALETCGVGGELSVMLGDQALFEAFLEALGLPAGWQRRLVRTFGDDALLNAALQSLSRENGGGFTDLDPELYALAHEGEADALARALRPLMEEAGLPLHSGRTPGEIAARLVEKVAVAETRLGTGPLDLLKRFLRIDCPLNEAGTLLRALAADAGLELEDAIRFFERRNSELEAVGVDLARIAYRAAFGRPIDYYTGMVFEIREEGGDEPLAGGGRYDRLMTYLGAPEPVPAVGFSLWLDRIQRMAGAGA